MGHNGTVAVVSVYIVAMGKKCYASNWKESFLLIANLATIIVIQYHSNYNMVPL